LRRLSINATSEGGYLTMNIALLAHDLHEHGGHSLYTRRLADAMSRQHDVTVFANRCERSIDESWTFTQVPAWRRSALATVATFPLGLRTRALELDQFTIRHAQGFCGGNPNIVTAHICVAAYLESLHAASVRTRLSLRLMAAAEKRFYRRYTGRVIAVSQKVADELREFYAFRGQISVIHHGVDAASTDSAFSGAERVAVRRELGIELNETVALYVGDLTKAHSCLKRLAAELPQVTFVIVTKSSRYHWTSPNVKIVLPTKQITRYYAAADAFVFPTTYDAFGMVVLEAMAAGLPVFTSDRAGAAELVTHGEDGFVFSLGDWVERTARAFRDGEMLSRVGVAARETAQRHDWNSVVAKVERVYFEVAAATEPSKVAVLSKDEYRYQRS
jgi:glycosyltransferase involved in cell wall biosynthesis